MVIGDFNNVLNVADIIGGNDIHIVEYSGLAYMMEETELHEHETRGSHFTWSNKQPNGMIYSRTDRAICNEEWFLAYPRCDIDVLNPHIYDHSPLKVQMMITNSEITRYKARFKVLNCTVEILEFMDIIIDNWNGID
ncbi:uncharacterized protein LOC127081149 [Lathyrus oleraceus]|uniref:uncharacterized protein LOC127081149 n=1 Tax=Pisum sativum TaxID=3888 RepID=UPI0021D0889C|nr:uncharacterized protein LOC127081149 [Pisum sativum]